jgi:hypothetical protein
MKTRKTIFLSDEERKAKDTIQLLREPAVLQNVSGGFDGAKRVLYTLAELRPAPGSKDPESCAVATIHENGSTTFILESGKRLKIDKIRGTASFTSQDVRYKIRSMNKDEVAFLASSDATGAAKKPEEK